MWSLFTSAWSRWFFPHSDSRGHKNVMVIVPEQAKKTDAVLQNQTIKTWTINAFTSFDLLQTSLNSNLHALSVCACLWANGHRDHYHRISRLFLWQTTLMAVFILFSPFQSSKTTHASDSAFFCVYVNTQRRLRRLTCWRVVVVACFLIP